jgi:hypothetical protein
MLLSILLFLLITGFLLYYYYFVCSVIPVEDRMEPRWAVSSEPVPDEDEDNRPLPVRTVLRSRYEYRDNYVEVSEGCENQMECIHWSRTESDIDEGFQRTAADIRILFLDRGIHPPVHFGELSVPFKAA